MNKPTIIYLVRHGESEHNKAGIFSGHGDPSLTQKGVEQVLKTKHDFEQRGIKFDVAYSSTLERAHQTAEIIYSKPIEIDKRLDGLKERNWGSLEGQPQTSVKEIDASKVAHDEAWHNKYVPDMESDHEVSSRFLKELERIAQSNSGKSILIVSHGGAIRTTLMRIEDKSYDEYPARSFKNAGWAKLIYQDGKFTVAEVHGS